MPIDSDYRKVYDERVKSPAPSIEMAITQFGDEYLTARNLAPLTRVNYTSDLKQLQRYLVEDLGLETVDQVQPRSLQGFLVTLDHRGLRGSSRRRKVATIRAFFRFLVQQGLLPTSPAEELLPPEREREERRVLSEAEYKRLMAAVQHEVRDGAILELLLQTIQIRTFQSRQKLGQGFRQFAVAQGRSTEDQRIASGQIVRPGALDVEQFDFTFVELLLDHLGDFAGITGIGGVEQTYLGHDDYLV